LPQFAVKAAPIPIKKERKNETKKERDKKQVKTARNKETNAPPFLICFGY
jgi:hypothetical protein